MGNGYAVELEASFFRNFTEFAIQLPQSLGLLMHETDRIDDDPSRIDLPNYRFDVGSRPWNVTVGMVLVAERVVADAEFPSDHAAHLLDVRHITWTLVHVFQRSTVGRKYECGV